MQQASEFESAHDALDEVGFFAYSGADGDLYRKNGVAGWRVSVHGRNSVRIQKKGRKFRGRNTWNTKQEWEVEHGNELSPSDLREIRNALLHLEEHGELPDA